MKLARSLPYRAVKQDRPSSASEMAERDGSTVRLRRWPMTIPFNLLRRHFSDVLHFMWWLRKNRERRELLRETG